MIARNTIVTGSFVLLALILFVLSQGPWFSPSDLQLIVAIIVIGVIAPLAVNEYLDRKADAG